MEETKDNSPKLKYKGSINDNKIKTINNYLGNSILPEEDDPYIDTKQCYFCLYNKIYCQLQDEPTTSGLKTQEW